jgi:hypothetical protein
MDINEILGMELDIALKHLQTVGANVDVQYTLPLLPPHERHTARVVRVNTVNETVMLTVTYETSRKGGADAWHT